VIFNDGGSPLTIGSQEILVEIFLGNTQCMSSSSLTKGIKDKSRITAGNRTDYFNPWFILVVMAETFCPLSLPPVIIASNSYQNLSFVD